jgi:hypothetical protein
MTLSNLFLLTTCVEHNAQKQNHTATDNGYFFLQAVYGQINIKKPKNTLTIPFLVALYLTIPREIPEEPLTNQRG